MLNPIVADQARVIIKFITTKTAKSVKWRDAYYLASFSFPLDQKLEVIKQVIERSGSAGCIYSALYFRSAFIEAERQFHKESFVVRRSVPVSVRDILFPPSSGTMNID